MSEEGAILTHKGLKLLRDLLLSLFLFGILAMGYWMIVQTMNAVVLLKRDYVDLPIHGLQLDVWLYHDAAYAPLWLSYVGIVVWEVVPWKKGRLTSGRVIISLLGFAVLTAGLWLIQDIMNAVLILKRNYVDMPFFAMSPDLYNTRSCHALHHLGFPWIPLIHSSIKGHRLAVLNTEDATAYRIQ